MSCTTHHDACDCREAMFLSSAEQLKAKGAEMFKMRELVLDAVKCLFRGQPAVARFVAGSEADKLMDGVSESHIFLHRALSLPTTGWPDRVKELLDALTLIRDDLETPEAQHVIAKNVLEKWYGSTN